MGEYRNVCEAIVLNDLCVGCGLCASVCPRMVLDIRFNEFGEYNPVEHREGCLPDCDLCLQTCPFWRQADNEDTLARAVFEQVPDIQHRWETGYFSDCYVGHAESDLRMCRTSGGLGTWFLLKLLEEGVVDKVVSVVAHHDPQKLFKFAVLDSADAVKQAARSTYYPVEMSEVLQYIWREDARYAVTGLPCFLKAIRLAMRKNRHKAPYSWGKDFFPLPPHPHQHYISRHRTCLGGVEGREKRRAACDVAF